ncbi:unnamed protein product [Porites evermanni]|uniref:Zinc finger MYM-type 2-like n=3 Tax=Porites evermanni TaxID=104178 RepID=A0ABN8SMT6_9CNID|nr:unnamed protein product [Porites evermanni]
MNEKRFVDHDTSVEDYVESLENRNTKEKTKRDVKLLETFLRNEKNDEREVQDIEPAELNKHLAEFIRSVRRKDGEDYEPSSLRCLVSSIERHLKKNNYTKSIINDKEFELFRKCLQAKQKELKKAGRGNKDKAAVAITDEEVDILHENNLLGVCSAESLLNTVWLNNTIHFGMRGCQEHRDLCWGDVKLCKDAQGNDYLVYNERQTKTRSGVDASNVRKVSPKMFSTGDERDPVVAYKIYREKRPENMMADDSPFYLGINHTKTDGSKKHWFKSAPMGVNKLNTLMKTMASKANINNERLTNHSARKHMIQKLNDSEIPPTHIMQLSGHKNVQSITNYSSLNLNQQKNISGILSRASSQTQVTTATNETAAASTCTSKTPMSFFDGAVISGGQFTISINALTTSPTIQTRSSVTETTEKRWKRIRIEESDSD